MALKDKELYKAYQKEYYHKNAERLRRAERARHASKRSKFLELPEEERKVLRDARQDKKYIERLKYDYGMSIDEYQSLLDSQEHSCKICKVKNEDLKQRLAVDHDHDTGKVRGLLCKSCNAALGLFKDSSEILVRAAEYLKRNK